MSPFRILIVDDQADVRRVLQAGIETLGIDYQVHAMLSAEEALVEASRKPIDLLVTDFRLPGMSGSELVSKMKRYCPDMKVFIITGMTDPNVHRQVKEAKPDDFFIKPVPLGDFLTAVKQTLDKVEKKHTTETAPVPEKKTQANKRLNDILAGARKELGAEAILLVDGQGRGLASAGKPPVNLPGFLSARLAGLMESSGLDQILGTQAETSLMLFKGKSKNLYLAYAGAGRALLLIINPESTNTFSDPTIELIFHALEEIRAVENLDQLVSSIANPASAPVSQPVSPAADTQTLPASTKPSETVMPIESEVAPEVLKQVEEHFELVTQNRLAPKQVEDFWNAAMEDDEARNARRANDINYDEARRLGLAPDEDSS